MEDAMVPQAANMTMPEFFLALYREKLGWYEERMKLEKEVMEEKLSKAEAEKRAVVAEMEKSKAEVEKRAVVAEMEKRAVVAEVEKSKAEVEKKAAVAEVKLNVATTEVLRLRGQLHMRGLMGKNGCREHVKP